MTDTKNIWTDDEQKILQMVMKEWYKEFQTIFRENKKSDLDNFLCYSRNSFIYKNIFCYAYEILKNHNNWYEWENYVKEFYIRKCISINMNRRKSII